METTSEFLPFEEAHQFVLNLGLKTHKEWNEYVKSGQKPENLPAQPSAFFRSKWVSFRHWLLGK